MNITWQLWIFILFKLIIKYWTHSCAEKKWRKCQQKTTNWSRHKKKINLLPASIVQLCILWVIVTFHESLDSFKSVYSIYISALTLILHFVQSWCGFNVIIFKVLMKGAFRYLVLQIFLDCWSVLNVSK